MAECVSDRLGFAGVEVECRPISVAVDGWVASSGSVGEFLGLLGGLSPQQRACVALRYVGGYTALEIGELLGTSAGTVRVQLHRAHVALRESISEAEHA